MTAEVAAKNPGGIPFIRDADLPAFCQGAIPFERMPVVSALRSTTG